MLLRVPKERHVGGEIAEGRRAAVGVRSGDEEDNPCGNEADDEADDEERGAGGRPRELVTVALATFLAG